MKALLIAEKPSLRRSIESVYKKNSDSIPYEITFMEQRGHLITLKNPSEMDEDLKTWSWDTLPIHPEEYGGWQYKIIKEQKTGNFLTAAERYKKIKEEINTGNYDFIINAGDPDQEGELLIRIVLTAIGTKLPIKRFWTNATTDQKILEALQNLKDDDNDPMLVNLLNAAYARQHSDYRFGMNISRAATLKMGTTVACGRVKTPIMSIVCKREEEINNFTPKTVYGVKALYNGDFFGLLFNDKTEDSSDEDEDENEKGIIWFDDIDEARDIINSLSDEAKVIKFEKKRVESLPPKFFKLATVQIAAGKIGYSSTETLAIIQGLYERGFLSYPRTDCEYISSTENLHAMLKSASCVEELKPYIDSVGNDDIKRVRGTKKWVNDKALQESGHSALTPTTKTPDFSNLTTDEQAIYALVCKQFVAAFLPPLVQNKTLLITDIDSHKFKSTGKTLVDKGFSELFGTKFNDMVIPEFSEGTIINVEDYETTEKTSVCPKRFTDADLIAACENPNKYLNDPELKKSGKKFKIGTPATRASIIEELIADNKYLQRSKIKNKTYIIPTNVGTLIFNNLRNCDICKVDMTSEWEDKLELIRTGSLELEKLENSMKDTVTDMVKEIKNTEMSVFAKENLDICDCPKCDGKIRAGSKSFYCTNWQEDKGACKVGAFKKLWDSNLSPKDFAKLLTGEIVSIKVKKDGKSWDQKFVYDLEECKLKTVKKEKVEPTESGYFCPNCGEVLLDDTRKLTCSENCGFSLWKTVCGKELNGGQITRLLEDGDTGLLKGLTSKAGKKFDAHLILKEDKISTEFSFDK